MAKKAFNYQKYFVNKAKAMQAKKTLKQSGRDDRTLEQACEQGDLSSVPLAALCSGIKIMMDELARRGKPIRDFDNKEKIVEQIQIIGNRVYFFAREQEYEENKEAE